MKKLFLILATIIGINLGAMAGETYSRDTSILPKAALTTLSNNFRSKVSLIKIDKTLGIVSEYNVILDDGTEIEFDRNGNWQSVETSLENNVPSGFILIGVSDFVAKNHSGDKIVGIERDGDNFEVELSNGINMLFNSDGVFQKYID